MVEHVLQVKGRDIAADNRLLYQGTANADIVRLVLDDEWKGLTAVLTFEGSGKTVSPARNGDGTYTVPWEVMTEAGTVKAKVEGTDGNKVLLHAVMSKPFIVQATDGTTAVPAESETIISEAVRKADEAAAKANEAAEKAGECIITEAEAETLDPGSKATAGLEKIEGGQKLKLGIPKGEKGDRGDCDYGILDIDDAGYLNAYYTTETPAIRFEMEGNDLRSVLEIGNG